MKHAVYWLMVSSLLFFAVNVTAPSWANVTCTTPADCPSPNPVVCAQDCYGDISSCSGNFAYTGTVIDCYQGKCQYGSSINCSSLYPGSTCTSGIGCVENKTNSTVCMDGYTATCSYQKINYPNASDPVCTPDCTGHQTAGCSSTNYPVCTTSTACTNAMGYWCPSTNTCMASSSTCGTSGCSSSNLSLCTTVGACSGASGNWCASNSQCYSSASSCPTSGTCSSSNYPGCTTEAQCTAAGVTGRWCPGLNGAIAYCMTSASQCPSSGTCSSSNYANCTTQSTCETQANGQWVSGVCSAHTQSSCSAIGKYWCATYGQCYMSSSGCPSSGSCSSTNYPACTTVGACQGINGYWCANNSQCYSSSSFCTTTTGYCGDHICNNGETNTTCATDCGTTTQTCATGYYWCTSTNSCLTNGTTCSTSSTCSPSVAGSCRYDNCTQNNGKWCMGGAYLNSYCTTANDTCTITADGGSCGNGVCNKGEGAEYGPVMCPADCGGTTGCSSQNPQGCTSSTDCERVGYKWCTTGTNGPYCENPTYNCSTPSGTTCPTGQYWNGNSCVSSSTTCGSGMYWCSSSNSCISNTSTCSPTGGMTCSSSNYGSCYDSTACSGAGGKWCANAPTSMPAYGGGGSNGYCTSSATTCPDYSCTINNLSYCTTESVCTGKGGNWCATGGSSYCQTGTCPTCTNTNKWACATESACRGTGGNWCKSPSGMYNCSDMTCPVCSKDQKWNCYTETECKNAGGNWKMPQYSGMGYCESSSIGTTPTGRCGDGICEGSETSYTCHDDCRPAYACGNQVCEGNEWQSCPMDCSRPQCPSEDEKAKRRAECVAKQWEVIERSSPDGCSYLECRPSGGECPNQDKIEQEIRQCKERGGNIVMRGKDNCRFAECKERPIYDECPNKEDEIRKCKEKGLGYDFIWPQAYMASSGNAPNVVCPIIKCTEGYKPPVIRPPQEGDCREEPDGYGGMRYVCKERKCPELDVTEKQKCYDKGGTPDVIMDKYNGCPRYTCGSPKSIYGCPPSEQLEKDAEYCAKAGGIVVTRESFNGCKEVGCDIQGKGGPDNWDKPNVCPYIEYSLIEEKRMSCEQESRRFMSYPDERGCPAFDCVSDQTCRKENPPKEVFLKCANQGGEYVVKRDDQSCIVFEDCIGRKETTEVHVEPPTEVLDTMEAIDVALKLERLLILLDKLGNQASELAQYYESTGSVADGDRFRKVQGMLKGSKQKVEKIKNYLRDSADKLTLKVLMEIKIDIVSLKDVTLKEVLYVMLGKDIKPVEQTETRNCEGSETCFMSALRVCEKAQFEHAEQEFKGRFEIQGLDKETNTCKIEIKAVIRGEEGNAICRHPEYATEDLGWAIQNKYCTGTLIAKMFEVGMQQQETYENQSMAANENQTEAITPNTETAPNESDSSTGPSDGTSGESANQEAVTAEGTASPEPINPIGEFLLTPILNTITGGKR